MGWPIRRGGVLEPQLSILPRTQYLVSPMTMVTYDRTLLSMVGITTYKMGDTAGHNLKHASNIRAIQVPPSYHTRFPRCVGLAPNSTATTLRTVKALDTDSSSRSTDQIGSGINSACITTHLPLYIIPRFSASTHLHFVTCHIFASSLL